MSLKNGKKNKTYSKILLQDKKLKFSRTCRVFNRKKYRMSFTNDRIFQVSNQKHRKWMTKHLSLHKIHSLLKCNANHRNLHRTRSLPKCHKTQVFQSQTKNNKILSLNRCLYYDCYVAYILLMHIKAFLKKISELPLSDTPCKQSFKHKEELRKRASRLLALNNTSANKSFCDSNITNPGKKVQGKLAYVLNHHPIVKSRLIRSRQSSPSLDPKIMSSPDPKMMSRVRERVEQKLIDIMNQRKQLIVTSSKIRRKNCIPNNYRTHRESKSQIVIKQVPDFIKNIMKPCQIKTISIGRRPSTIQRFNIRSQPKIYCKKLLPTNKGRKGVFTADICQKRRFTIDVEKLDAWDGENKEQQQQFWVA